MRDADDVFVLTCDPPHHRFEAGRAVVPGSVTHHILRRMPVPLLMAH